MPARTSRRTLPWRSPAMAIALLAVALTGCSGQTGDPPRPGVSGSCSVSFKVTAEASPFTITAVDRTIRMCGSYGDWKLGLRERPTSIRGREPVEFLVSRCTDASSGLSMFAVCQTLMLALATPPPTPRTTAPRTEVAITTPRPDKRPDDRTQTADDGGGNGKQREDCGRTQQAIRKGAVPCTRDR